MALTFNLADLTEAAIDRVPERQALITAERTLTYAGLEERANRLAAWLAAQVSVRATTSAATCSTAPSTSRRCSPPTSCGPFPINVNYRYVEDELRYLFRDADLKALVHDVEFAAADRSRPRWLAAC